jgi:hypothetical protein
VPVRVYLKGREFDAESIRVLGIAFVIGPDVPPMRFRSRPEARDWCKTHYSGSPIKESGRDASKRRLGPTRKANEPT